jgi:hypothetical protein
VSVARETAKSAVCLSNLRSLGLIFGMYCNDNNESFPIGFVRIPKHGGPLPLMIKMVRVNIFGFDTARILMHHHGLRAMYCYAPVISINATDPVRWRRIMPITAGFSGRIICRWE